MFSEPEKLQLIQQYLRSSAQNASTFGNNSSTSGPIFLDRLNSSSCTFESSPSARAAEAIAAAYALSRSVHIVTPARWRARPGPG